MSDKSPQKGRGDDPLEKQSLRVESKWPVGARELEDLSRLAERIRHNPQRRGEANAYVIRLWSQVLHGEISTTAFWEMFGVVVPVGGGAVTPPAAQQGSLRPSAGQAYDPTPTGQEISQPENRRANRARNRAAAAKEWET